MWRPVSTLKIPHYDIVKLQEKGFIYCEDIQNVLSSNPDEIPESVKTIIDRHKIKEQIDFNNVPKIHTLSDLWEYECHNSPVAVFHKGLDKLLNGGLQIGRITELCGGPGSGKTQMCFQFAIDAQMPSALGGSASEVLFISTDLSFSRDRITEMGSETINHVKKILPSHNFTLDSILQSINLIQIQGYEELVHVINNIHDFFETNKNVKLLIVDSFSLPFVCGFTDLLERTKIVNDLLDILLRLAMKHEFAVVLTNQLTTLIISDSKKKLIPSLGESFGHRIHTRLLLDNGKVCLTKSINQNVISTQFKITTAGIR